MSRATLVVATSDQHVNSTVGLCPPAVTLDDGGTYRATEVQLLQWSYWKEFWNFIESKKKEYKAQVVALYVGDLNDLNVYNALELISRNPADVLRMTVETMDPALQVANVNIIIRGTQAHTGKQANLEEAVARDIKAEKDPETDRYSWWWFYGEMGGVTFDAAHHPDTSGWLPHTEKPAAARHADVIRRQYLEAKRDPPHVAFRAHNHRYIPYAADSNTRPWFFYLPGWQFVTSNARRRGATFQAHKIGGMWFVCKNGRIVEWNVWRRGPKMRKPWTRAKT